MTARPAMNGTRNNAMTRSKLVLGLLCALAAANAKAADPGPTEAPEPAPRVEARLAGRSDLPATRLRLGIKVQQGRASPEELAALADGEPPDPQASLATARLLAAQGAVAEAVERLDALREQFPNSTTVLMELGLLHFRQGAFTEGIAYLEKAVSIDPFLAEAHHKLAWAYAASEQPEKALQHASAALMLDQPGSERARKTLKEINGVRFE
jgi:tetratricopeptide (TPR) repeat protein